MEFQLVEPAIVPDIFVSGLADAEDLGDGNVRFTYYTNQRSFHDRSGTIEHIIVARIIIPLGALITARELARKRLSLDMGLAH